MVRIWLSIPTNPYFPSQYRHFLHLPLVSLKSFLPALCFSLSSLHTLIGFYLIPPPLSFPFLSFVSSFLCLHLPSSTLCATLTLPSSLSWIQTHYFGLWFQGKNQAPAHRWVELEKPLKKQLDKFGNEPLLFFGVMFYVPSVSRLEQEATR